MAGPILITGGGTGGHIFPMTAIADALIERGLSPSDIVFVGSRRGQERQLLAARSERVILLPGRGLLRSLSPRALGRNLLSVIKLAAALTRALWIVVTMRPSAVVSVGGYAAFPVVAAASLWPGLRGKRIFVELDSVLGLVHRRFAFSASHLLFGLPTDLHDARVAVVGVPLRHALESAATQASRDAARQRLGVSHERRLVVVMTGSLGARSVNEAVLGLASRWSERRDVALIHVTGRRDYADLAARVPELRGLDYRQMPFADDMASLWSAADVAITRAGANTVAELTLFGVAAVMVPLPGAPGDHQGRNAAALVARGAGLLCADVDLSSSRLDELLTPLLNNDEAREDMAQAARSLAVPGAAERIARVVLGSHAPTRVHVVGAGGAGMSGVVRYFAEQGARVSGSDAHSSSTLQVLSRYGEMRVGHFPEAAAAADIVTWSPAVNAERDPDILASAPGARCSRRDLIGRIASEHHALAVTGTHGKTTATSMLALIMDSARRKPSWLLGAPIRGLGDNGHYDGRDLVLELDESYGTFGVVTASALGIVNIDADHLDHYGTLENLEASFCEVAARTTGPVVFWRDGVRDGVAQQLVDGGALAISENVHDEWYVSDIVSTPTGSSWHLHTPATELRLHLNVPGRHNVANASVAAALALENGVSGDDIIAGLARFVGAPRRFDVKGRLEGALVVDDYAHLPREVEATLAAARDAGCERILAVFQPHRVTRTWATYRDFATSFALASEVVVSDIYTSGEPNLEGLTGKLVADALTTPSSSHVHYIADLDALATWVGERATNYDAVIVMGAGDVNSIINHWELRS